MNNIDLIYFLLVLSYYSFIELKFYLFSKLEMVSCIYLPHYNTILLFTYKTRIRGEGPCVKDFGDRRGSLHRKIYDYSTGTDPGRPIGDLFPNICRLGWCSNRPTWKIGVEIEGWRLEVLLFSVIINSISDYRLLN